MARAANTPPVETAKAAQAFADYVQLGPKRSLETLAAAYRISTEPAPTLHLRTLKEWSAKYRWQERIREAVTEATTKALEEAAELDAATFLETSRRLYGLITGTEHIHPQEVVRVRESVRKPEPKSTVDVRHTGTIKHAHHDMSAFTDDEIVTLAAIAERQKAEAGS